MRDPKLPKTRERRETAGEGRPPPARGRTFSQTDKEEITAKIDRVTELLEKSQHERPEPTSVLLPIAAQPVTTTKSPPALVALQRRIGQIVIALGVGIAGYYVRDCEARFGVNLSQVAGPWPSEPPTRPEPWKRPETWKRDGGNSP